MACNVIEAVLMGQIHLPQFSPVDECHPYLGGVLYGVRSIKAMNVPILLGYYVEDLRPMKVNTVKRHSTLLFIPNVPIIRDRVMKPIHVFAYQAPLVSLPSLNCAPSVVGGSLAATALNASTNV